MGGGGKHPPIPDWRSFKIEDAPDLVRVQQVLASYGLKDPWLRNEVWRFNVKTFGTLGQRARIFLFRGFKWGLILAVTHASLKTLLSKDDHHHGHGASH